MFSLLRDVIEILQSLGTFSVIKQNWSSNFDLRNLFSDILVIDISPSFGIIILIEMLANMVCVLWEAVNVLTRYNNDVFILF